MDDKKGKGDLECCDRGKEGTRSQDCEKKIKEERTETSGRETSTTIEGVKKDTAELARAHDKNDGGRLLENRVKKNDKA